MVFFFFFNDTATTEIYTLSLHDALPISPMAPATGAVSAYESGTNPIETNQSRLDTRPRSSAGTRRCFVVAHQTRDRKSTRLNSSHANILYAVFCLKKKKKNY